MEEQAIRPGRTYAGGKNGDRRIVKSYGADSTIVCWVPTSNPYRFASVCARSAFAKWASEEVNVELSAENDALLARILPGRDPVALGYTTLIPKDLERLLNAARTEGAQKWINAAAALGSHEARELATEGWQPA